MSYKSKPQIFTAIFVCLTGYLLYRWNDGFLSILFALVFMVAAGVCLFVPRLTINFYNNIITVRIAFADSDEINKKDILDVSITNKKIYVQTRHKNFTINKSFFDSDKFDEIVNKFLKVKAENNLTK